MGCGASSEKKSLKEHRKISHKFQETHIEALDAYFKDVEGFLERAEKLRSSIAEAYEEILTETDVDALNDVNAKLLCEAIKIIVWFVAANNGGTIPDGFINIDIKDKKPVIEIDYKVIKVDVKAIKPVERLIHACGEVVDASEELVEKVKKIGEESAAKMSEAKDQLKADPMKAIKAAKPMANNLSALTEQLGKVTGLLGLLKELIEQLTGIPAALKALATSDVHKKAFEQKVTQLKDIFWKFTPANLRCLDEKALLQKRHLRNVAEISADEAKKKGQLHA